MADHRAAVVRPLDVVRLVTARGDDGRGAGPGEPGPAVGDRRERLEHLGPRRQLPGSHVTSVVCRPATSGRVLHCTRTGRRRPVTRGTRMASGTIAPCEVGGESERGGPHERRRAEGRRGAGPLARHPGGAGGRGRGAGTPRHPGADRVQRGVRLRGRGHVGRRRPGPARGHIYSRNTNPTVAAFEEKVRLPRGGGGGHELLHRHGRRQQHALRAARAGRARRLRQGHVRRHQPDVRRLPAAHRRRGRRSATRATSTQIEAAVAGGAACSTSRRRPTRRSRSWTSPGSRPRPTRPARSWSPTTPSRRPSTRTRWRWAPTSCCTAPPSSSAATPTRSAACSAARRARSRRSTTTARSPARPSTRWPPTCCAQHQDAALRVRQQNESAMTIARWLQRSRTSRPSTTRASSRTRTTTSRRGRCAATAAC